MSIALWMAGLAISIGLSSPQPEYARATEDMFACKDRDLVMDLRVANAQGDKRWVVKAHDAMMESPHCLILSEGTRVEAADEQYGAFDPVVRVVIPGQDGEFYTFRLPLFPVSPPTEPVEEPAEEEATDLPDDTEEGPFTIQVAAFRDRAAAERMLERLAGRGIEGYVEGTPAGIFRVRVGEFETREQARTLAARLESDQFATLVTPR